MFRISTVVFSKYFRHNVFNLKYKLNQHASNVRFSLANFSYINSTTDNSPPMVHTNKMNNIVNPIESLRDAYKKHARIYVRSIESCLGETHEDQNTKNRQALCEQVWEKLKKAGILNVLCYNTYIQICIENSIYLNHKEFLKEMDCDANEDTYKLLLRCVCEFGDTQKALEILALMKDQKFSADEHVFTSLVLAHAIKGGLKEVMPVLKTMQTAHIPVSSEIANSVIRGLVLHNNKTDFLDALQEFGFYIKETNLIQLMLMLGQTDNLSWLDNVTKLLGFTQISKDNSADFDLMCIRLVHLGKVDAAMSYYEKFTDPSSIPEEGNYAFFLLFEMLLSNTPVDKIIGFIKRLEEDGLNLTALQKLTIIALKKRLFNVAWELVMTMPYLRPHYFWPFLLQSSRQEGEIGVMNTLRKMIELKIRPDMDTLEYYCLHLCDTSDPDHIVTQLQHLGLSLREILTPLLACLLNQNKLDAAIHICKSYDAYISSDRLLKPLIKIWVSTKDISNTIKILKRINSNSHDYIGQFLSKIVLRCKSSEDCKYFLNLIQALAKANLSISSPTAEIIINRLKRNNPALFKEIELAINNVSVKTIASNTIPHPRQMNVTDLENHLIELESKQMETRGVLRRLITEYCRLGNYKRAFELRKKVISNGYEESPGMKTAILHAYILENSVNDALNMYSSIKQQYPNFNIDEFKIIDLATVLVKNKQLKEAINILHSEASVRKIQGGSQLVRNCWKLIGSGENEVEVQKLFDVLVEEGYCLPGNIILGPLIKIHLKNDDLGKAVSVFKKCTEKYNCTPLQLELLCALVESENLDLLQETLNYCSRVHGYEATIIPAVAAFAQNGLHKPLRKFLIEINGISRKELEKRCERWVNEHMILPLETLAKVSYSLPPHILDKDVIYYSLMKLYSINSDCEAAVSFYRKLLEIEIRVSKRITDELLRLIQRCKYEVPKELCQ